MSYINVCRRTPVLGELSRVEIACIHEPAPLLSIRIWASIVRQGLDHRLVKLGVDATIL